MLRSVDNVRGSQQPGIRVTYLAFFHYLLSSELIHYFLKHLLTQAAGLPGKVEDLHAAVLVIDPHITLPPAGRIQLELGPM